ncbi:hypothetical protein ACIQ62_03875 [Streptomyces sp. NPDC096319]|uniref:hypothetical protein n=1 Tax=Streptomyces sp. NPDC096319 TaxID=3366084 RepID=UPI0038222B73
MNAGKALSAWIGASAHVKVLGVVVTSFTDVDTGTANAFFPWWHQTKDVPKSQDGQGGYTVGVGATQRNLRALFVCLAEEYHHPNPSSMTAWRSQGTAHRGFGTSSQSAITRCSGSSPRVYEPMSS